MECLGRGFKRMWKQMGWTGVQVSRLLCVVFLANAFWGTAYGQAEAQANGDAKGAEAVDPGKDLVSINFPEPTEIKHIIQTVAEWTGKNVILDRNATGRVQMISPKKVTREEAYQAFLSALNLLNLTTVETGKIIKIVPIRNAIKGNLKTIMGTSWTPRTDEVITQIVPLKYIDARQIQTTLSRIVSPNAMLSYPPTNTLIISDTGFKVKRMLDIIKLLDVQTQQPKVAIIPIKYADPKGVADKVQEILTGASSKSRSKSRGSFLSYKILTDERSNAVIIFGPPRTIKDVKALVKKFDTPVDDASRQASIHVRPLDYADAKTLATTLSSLASANSSNSSRRTPSRRPPRRSSAADTPSSIVADLGEDVKVTADESSNSLLITGSREAYHALNSLIRKLDVRRSQVFVEADILDITIDNGFNFGTSIFAGQGQEKGVKTVTTWEAGQMGPLVVGAAQSNSSTSSTVNPQLQAEVAKTFSQDFTIGILSGQSVTVPGLGEFTPGGLIKLIKADSNTKVLSSPHILTSNNEEAEIVVGSKLFFPSSEINATTQTAAPKVEKEDVDLTLNIKPNISRTDYITMNVKLNNNTVAGRDPTSNLPIVAKRQTTQLVTAKNGQTVVISGLVQTQEFESYRKIPLLGDIPILGWLFRNSTLKKIRNNLMIFLTPYIVHGADDLAAVYKSKLEERDQFLASVYGDDYKEDDFYALMPQQKDGVYKPDPIDDLEKERRKKIQEQMYQDLGLSDEEIEKEEKAQSDKPEEEITIPDMYDSGDDGGVPSFSEPPPDPVDIPEPEIIEGPE